MLEGSLVVALACLKFVLCHCCFVNLGKPRIVRSPLSGHSSFPLQLPFFLVVDVMLCLCT